MTAFCCGRLLELRLVEYDATDDRFRLIKVYENVCPRCSRLHQRTVTKPRKWLGAPEIDR